MASSSTSSPRATWASGARSPLQPSDPNSGTSGSSPPLSRRSSAAASSGRAPVTPVASVRARSSTMARVTSGSTGSPIPAAWEAMSDRWSRVRSAGGIHRVASPPKPVEIP